MEPCLRKNRLVLKIDVVPLHGRCACTTQKLQPYLAYLPYHRRKLPAVVLQLRRENVSLLRGHSLRRRPCKPQQERRHRQLSDYLLQKLTDGHLRVNYLVIRTDDLYIHVSHRHKVTNLAAAHGVHAVAPFLGDLLGAFLCESHFAAVRGLVGNGVPHVSHTVEILTNAFVYPHKYRRNAGQTPQHRLTVRAPLRGIQRAVHHEPRIFNRYPPFALAPEINPVAGIRPRFAQELFRTYGSKPENVTPIGINYKLSRRRTVGQHTVQKSVCKSVQGSSPNSHGNFLNEPVKLLLPPRVGAYDPVAAGETYYFLQSRVHNGNGVPQIVIEPVLLSARGLERQQIYAVSGKPAA